MSKVALFDVGNTALKICIADNARLGDVVVHDHAAMTSKKLVQALRGTARENGLEGAIACSVSPSNCTRLREAWGGVSRVPLLFLNNSMKLPIKLKYPQPATIGPDRLAAASASFVRLKGEHIVVDAGTAATMDCVDAKGRFVGGAIIPGPGVASEYLSAKTGLLPEVKFGGPVPKLGRSTEGAMKIGVRVGYRGMLRAVLQHLSDGAFSGRSVPIVVTGGYAKRAASDLGRGARVMDNLTLEGLALIYEMNM